MFLTLTGNQKPNIRLTPVLTELQDIWTVAANTICRLGYWEVLWYDIACPESLLDKDRFRFS